MAELKPRKVKPKKSNVFSKILSWFLILAFISLSGYLGYIVIQLKTDKRVAEQETQVQVLEGQVQILQVTIEKLKLEGENLQKNPDLSKYEQSSFKKDIISTKSVAKVTAYACPTKKNVHTWTDKEIEMKLKKTGWNSEQIKYVMRKYVGKRTGMFEIPINKILNIFKKKKHSISSSQRVHLHSPNKI